MTKDGARVVTAALAVASPGYWRWSGRRQLVRQARPVGAAVLVGLIAVLLLHRPQGLIG